MNHDDIIRMAREVADPDTTDPLCGGDYRDLITLNLDEMVRFANLVAAAEREACARVCDDTDVVRFWHGGLEFDDGNRTLGNAAAAIRARGEEPKRHPGYIMGEHWLQAAYTRICTGETEAEVMADYGWQRESR
jgi:hypothetical protein